MSNAHIPVIRRRLDDVLSLASFERDSLPTDEVATEDHKSTLFPRLDDVDSRLKGDIATQFERLGSRNITSIFDDLGSTDPEDASFETVAPDRLELDRLVLRELLGFDEETHRELYQGFSNWPNNK